MFRGTGLPGSHPARCVVATGMDTEIGAIQGAVTEASEKADRLLFLATPHVLLTSGPMLLGGPHAAAEEARPDAKLKQPGLRELSRDPSTS